MAIDAMPEPEAGSDAIEIWDISWESFAVFRACATQWRVVALHTTLVHLGLDYQGLEVVMRTLLPPGADRAAVLSDVMVMESEALPILNEVAA